MRQGAPLAPLPPLAPLHPNTAETTCAQPPHHTGERGARIDPKGYKVRSTRTGARRTRVDKQGRQKYKVKETNEDHIIYAARTPLPDGYQGTDRVEVIWDTGAMSTAMNQVAATKLGYDAALVHRLGRPEIVQGVGGTMQTTVLQMSFYVQVAGGDWRLVSGGANVAALNTENLLVYLT